MQCDFYWVQQRVEILKALNRGAKILILDEPTGVLTPQETIGLFNILGSIFAGWYISKRSMRIFLSYTYFARCIIVLLFLASPKDLISVILFSTALGLTYFSVIPATAGLVGKMFGPQFMATLFGFALFSHQIGGFLGAYLGGYFFSVTGDYTTVWLLDAALAVFAALIHLPIKEKLVYSEVT